MLSSWRTVQRSPGGVQWQIRLSTLKQRVSTVDNRWFAAKLRIKYEFQMLQI